MKSGGHGTGCEAHHRHQATSTGKQMATPFPPPTFSQGTRSGGHGGFNHGLVPKKPRRTPHTGREPFEIDGLACTTGSRAFVSKLRGLPWTIRLGPKVLPWHNGPISPVIMSKLDGKTQLCVGFPSSSVKEENGRTPIALLGRYCSPCWPFRLNNVGDAYQRLARLALSLQESGEGTGARCSHLTVIQKALWATPGPGLTAPTRKPASPPALDRATVDKLSTHTSNH